MDEKKQEAYEELKKVVEELLRETEKVCSNGDFKQGAVLSLKVVLSDIAFLAFSDATGYKDNYTVSS